MMFWQTCHPLVELTEFLVRACRQVSQTDGERASRDTRLDRDGKRQARRGACLFPNRPCFELAGDQ
jgi:hypothetical protein